MQKLMVYGTLKKNFSNQPLLDDQKYLGKAVTAEAKFLLYECHGNYVFPALVQSKTGEGYQVFGELYEVSEKCLAYLDRIEGVAIGLYARVPIKVVDENQQLHEDVIAYCFQRPTTDLTPIGPVWPISELSRYRMVGHRFEEEEQEIEEEGVALYNTHADRWATGVCESEAALRKRCYANRIRYGVKLGSEDSWSSKWFEPRPRKVTKTVMMCRMRGVSCKCDKFSDGCDCDSPIFKDRDELATWAAEHFRFFGSTKGEPMEWRKVIAQVAPRIDED